MIQNGWWLSSALDLLAYSRQENWLKVGRA
jgi:hypothetical protein